MSAEITVTGVVKWFSDKKGYGFIMPDNGGKDLFVHYNEIDVSGFKTLKEGQRVQYITKTGDKGEHATGVRVLESLQNAV